MPNNPRVFTYHDYDKGHCWYYKLGGPIPYPKAIRDDIINKVANPYRGYLQTEIQLASRKTGGERSDALKAIKERCLDELRRDLKKYRFAALQISRRRAKYGLIDYTENAAHSTHVAISLIYAHLFNDFAHLHYIEELLAEQPDLFGY